MAAMTVPPDFKQSFVCLFIFFLTASSETCEDVQKLIVVHAGPAEGTKLHARKTFRVFYPIEFKLCTMIELFIPNNRIDFVFSF